MYPLTKTRRLLAIWVILALTVHFPGCASTPQEEEEQESMVGGPPRGDDDSLFRHALPAEAVAAEATGQVGVPDAPEDVDVPDAFEDVDVPDDPGATPEHPDGESACFSCIRICPVDEEGRADCSDGSNDLICGWGSHGDSQRAQQMAQAQCDASLDMARYMPTYADIEGQCPPATCR